MSTGDKPTRVRSRVLPLLAFAAASAYLTRHGLAVANTTMQEELHFNNEQFSYLNSAFPMKSFRTSCTKTGKVFCPSNFDLHIDRHYENH